MKKVIILFLAILGLSFAGSSFAQNVEYVNSTLWTSVKDVKVVGNFAYYVLIFVCIPCHTAMRLTESSSLSIIEITL